MLTYLEVAMRRNRLLIRSGVYVLLGRLIADGPTALVRALAGTPEEVAVVTLVANENDPRYLERLADEHFGQPIWDAVINALKRDELEQMTIDGLLTMLDFIQFSSGSYQPVIIRAMLEKAGELDLEKLCKQSSFHVSCSINLLRGQLPRE